VLVQRLRLADFRNYAAVELALSARFTVVWGHNGAGKTNLLEAVWLTSTLRSFRTSDLGGLVRHGASAAAVDVRVGDDGLGLGSDLGVRLQRGTAGARRTAIADGKPVRAAADFYGRLPAILFTPEDLAVLRGSPSGRRQFVDRMLFARERAHIVDVQAYEKLLRSRNVVLRDDALARGEREQLLATYEDGLADVGARIWTRRARLLELLRAPICDAFARIHGAAGPTPTSGAAPQVELAYRAALGDVDENERRAALAEGLATSRREDERRGATSLGPHRDDLVVELDARLAGEFASQGQTRALVLAFKLAELHAAAAGGRRPLLLLDDVSSELDPERSAMLFAALGEDVGQCILTTTSPDFIRLPADAEVARVGVDRGVISA
jgi:DNA replication and repair protein RecF